MEAIRSKDCLLVDTMGKCMEMPREAMCFGGAGALGVKVGESSRGCEFISPFLHHEIPMTSSQGLNFWENVFGL